MFEAFFLRNERGETTTTTISVSRAIKYENLFHKNARRPTKKPSERRRRSKTRLFGLH
jgi:hypothetical protein